MIWPDDHEDISTRDDDDEGIVCEGRNATALHREHRRIIAYYDSVTVQYKALQLDDPDMQVHICPWLLPRPLLISFRYHRRAAYHYNWIERKPVSTGRDYEDCDSCKLVTHARRHIQAALDACNAGFDLDMIRYGRDHPVIEETIRRSMEIRD